MTKLFPFSPTFINTNLRNHPKIENYEERTYEEYNRWLWKNEPMGQTCQWTPSIMKMMIQKSISLPLLKKNDRLLTRQIEEEEFWKQFDRREQIIWLINEIDGAITEDSQTINITFVSNFRLKGRQLKDWKSYPPNQIILRDRKLWRLNIFRCIKTKDDITTNNTINNDTTNNETKNNEWRMIVTRRRLAEPMERNHEHQNEHSLTFDLEWFKNDLTLIY